MPSSESYFEGFGIGTKYKLQPISVRFPADVHEALSAMSDRQSYIRQAVEEKLKADGLLPGNPNP